MSQSSKLFVRAADEPNETVDKGIQRQMLGFGPSLMMAKVTFEEGSIGYIHSHEHTQVSYVESGEFEVTVDGEVTLLGPGDAFYVPPNAPHGAVCKRAGVLIDVFSPMREDFINDD